MGTLGGGLERSRNDAPMELAGVYAAKWHYTAEGWFLQAEIFTPLTVTRGSAKG